jgi:Fe2+ or Zn2+ uptake regulation protein
MDEIAAEKGKKATFQYIEDGHHCEEHLHLQCIKCGRIFHLECEFMDEIAAHIQSEHGFFIECKRSIIYGENLSWHLQVIYCYVNTYFFFFSVSIIN